MPDGNVPYTASTLNINGYTIMLPNIGDPQDIKQTAPPNPYVSTSAQLFPLGTKLIQGERVWRYCKNAAVELAIAVPVQGAARADPAQDDDIACGAGSSIGDYTVSLTGTGSLDASPNDEDDNFAEGYWYANDLAGEGQCRKIKSNEKFAASGESIFTLYDPLTIATTTATQSGLIQNPYRNVVALKQLTTGTFVGVPNIVVATSDYFWCQTGGPTAVIQNATIALGTEVIVGTTAAKVNPRAAFDTEIVIGYPLTPAVTTDTDSFLMFLTLDR